MTWEFQATVSDDIHRLVTGEGESLWGVAHDGFDADHSEALGVVDVDLPSGRASLLLVKPLPGGLILDAVRSYQGLVEGELSTLFLGVFDELLQSSDAGARLCLECIGLDAAGRPRIIPGIRREPASSPRVAIGEMIYHAAHGRPWEESLLPVDIALPECSASLRGLVAQLLDDADVDSTLHDTVAEVAVALRRTGAPSALPLLPAERDLDPGQALTARLRAANPPAASKSEHSTGTAGRLREASRAGARKHRRRDPGRRRSISPASRMALLTARGRGLLQRVSSKRPRREKSMIGVRTCVILASALTLIGGAVMVHSWGSKEPAASVSSPQESAVAIADEEAVAALEDLCDRRSAALSAGDVRGLKALTVPDSSAAAADELLDLQAFAGNDYSIELEDPVVREQTDQRILIEARMLTSASVSGEESGFAPQRVEFELCLDAGEWKIREVTDIGT